MTILNSESIREIIAKIKLKNDDKLVNLISDIVIKENNIGFSMDISRISREEAEELRNQALAMLNKVEGIGKVTIILTTHNTSTDKKSTKKQLIDKVKKVLLVASGKGGVGKSTMAALIAQQLRDQNFNVGIVDADIYGPSIPQIFKINEKPIVKDKMMLPVCSQNIQINSIGFLVDSDAALAWRGPMASKAIYQLLSLTQWNNLDYLIIDMPPGTGDIHLSIIENYQIDGVFIVTTPQKISQIDVQKAINLYQKFNISVLGIIENMSYYFDESSKKCIEIFSGNGGELLAALYNIPLIAKLPISVKLAEACDEGKNLSDIMHLPLAKFLTSIG